MRLVLQLVARLLLIVALCLGAATVWATFDAYRSVDRATAASAQRVAQALGALYWHELLLRSSRTREHLLPLRAINRTVCTASAFSIVPASHLALGKVLPHKSIEAETPHPSSE